MPSSTIQPQNVLGFPGDANGYTVLVHEDYTAQPVLFWAQDQHGQIIAAGLSPGHHYQEFRVRPNIGFTVINVGENPLDITWVNALGQTALGDHGAQGTWRRTKAGADEATELDQTLSNLPWMDGFEPGVGVDAITGGIAGRAVAPFVPKPSGAKNAFERYRFIENAADLNREIEASASGKYNIEGVKVSASTSYLQKIQLSELEITLIAEYQSSSATYDDAEGYSLTDEAKALIGEPEAFRKAFGDYFVAGGRRASRFLALYRLRAATARNMDEFKASFGGNVPELFTAEGSARFLQATSKNHIEISIDVVYEGVPSGPVPGTPTKPEEVIKVLDWFKANEKGTYLSALLKHYSTIVPSYPRTIDVVPEIFVELRLLYAQVWDIRAQYASLPRHYQSQYQQEYREIDYGVEASQQSLAVDASQRQRYRDAAYVLGRVFADVHERMDFYQKVRAQLDTEPAQGQVTTETLSGPQSWSYGFSVYGKSKAVVIHQTTLSYGDTWHVGYREGTLAFGPDGKYLIVGWTVISNWGDGTNGEWSKTTPRILLTSDGAVHVKSQYDRGCSWSVTYYYVDASDYQF